MRHGIYSNIVIEFSTERSRVSIYFSIATSESWKDKNTGERRERTEWHRVVIFSEGLANIAEQYLRKGSKVYLEGSLQTRSYEQDGIKKYSTEVVLQGFNSTMTMLGSNDGNFISEEGPSNAAGNVVENTSANESHPPPGGELDDEIPF